MQTIISLADLFEELDGYDDRVPLAVLADRLPQLRIHSTQIQPFVHFGTDHYRRNLIRTGRAYHALILCWQAGQRSPIHDHRGSSCGVRVLSGTCTETVFDRTPCGHVFPTRSRRLEEGYCCGSQDEDIHQISNLEADGKPLITLHIYSPPLMKMGTYSLTSPARVESTEPVHEFTAGAGI